jgi:Domain of unknown function (DUF2382)
VHLVEEVLLRKEVTARTETIHDTVRRDTLEIEQPPASGVSGRSEASGEKRGRNSGNRDENQVPQIGNKASEQKRS